MIHLNPNKTKCIIMAKKRPLSLRNQFVNNVTGKIFGLQRKPFSTHLYTTQHIRVRLAKTFLMSLLLYGWELFTSCDAKSMSRLSVAYNAILRYVYGLRSHKGCYALRKTLYRVDFTYFLKVRTLKTMHKTIYTKSPPYLFN